MDATWTDCKHAQAPEGVEVETKIDDANGCRNVQTLVRYGRLWFVDTRKSMSVYYTPTHWRSFAP